MRRRLSLLSLAFLLAACGGSSDAPTGNDGASRPELLILCSSANKPAMEEIADAFERERGVTVTMTFGGSGTLLSQCRLSGRGDIYLPASSDYIRIGERQGLLAPNSDTVVCYLVPSIIVARGNPKGIKSLEDLARSDVRVAIANPEAVAVGLFAVEILQRNHLLETVFPRVVTFAENVEKLAAMVSGGNVDAVIGWSVLEDWNPDQLERVSIPGERIPRLAYVPILIPVSARDTALARAFISLVMGPVGREAYSKRGYQVTEAEARVLAPQALIGGEYALPAAYFELIKRR